MTLDVVWSVHIKTLPDGALHVGAMELNSGWRHAVRLPTIRLDTDIGSLDLGVALNQLAQAWWEQAGPGRVGDSGMKR